MPLLAVRQANDALTVAIELYQYKPARYAPHDPAAPRVASLVSGAIATQLKTLTVDHIGSTAVPGCGGKGIIDLLVSYPAGALAAAVDALAQLGFQPQGGADPFPESRPMRVGVVRFRGKEYSIHAHVIQCGAREGLDLIQFRDQLRADAALVRAYQLEKLSILARGVTMSTEYSKAKTDFIHAVLAQAE